MNSKSYKQIGEYKEPKKICANHPVSSWKEGYKRCYWGFKLKQDCVQLNEEGGEKKLSYGLDSSKYYEY